MTYKSWLLWCLNNIKNIKIFLVANSKMIESFATFTDRDAIVIDFVK